MENALSARRGAQDRPQVLALLAELDAAPLRDVLVLGVVDESVTSALSAAHSGLRWVFAEPGAPLAVPDAGFDLVVTSASYHRSGAWQATLEEISRVLRPGAHLLWIDLDVDPAQRTQVCLWRHRYGLYTPDEVRAAHSPGDRRPERLYRRIGAAVPPHSALILVKAPRAAA